MLFDFIFEHTVRLYKNLQNSKLIIFLAQYHLQNQNNSQNANSKNEEGNGGSQGIRAVIHNQIWFCSFWWYNDKKYLIYVDKDKKKENSESKHVDHM